MADIVLFASGSGSNFQAICEALAETPHRVRGLICDRPEAGVLDRARRLGVSAVVITYSGRGDEARTATEARFRSQLDRWQPDIIALAGFMRILSPTFVHAYEGRIINIHPALLPAYPGLHAIERSYKAGDKVLGITVHFVDDGVDTGSIIRQESIRRKDGESLEELETRMHELEHRTYPAVIADVLDELHAATEEKAAR